MDIPNKTKIRNVKIGLSADGYLKLKSKLKWCKMNKKIGPNGLFIAAERKSIIIYSVHIPAKNVFNCLFLSLITIMVPIMELNKNRMGIKNCIKFIGCISKPVNDWIMLLDEEDNIEYDAELNIELSKPVV